MSAIEIRDLLFQNLIKPLMKNNGYKFQAGKFIKASKLDYRFFHFTNSKFNTTNEVDIRLNIGFYKYEVMNLLNSNCKINDPVSSPSILDFSANDILNLKKETPWTYKIFGDSSYSLLQETIYSDLMSIIEFLEKLTNPNDYVVLDTYDKKQSQIRQIYCMVLLVCSNDMLNASKMYNQLIEKFNGHQKIKYRLIEYAEYHALT